jgi:phosphohistidine phosphatase
MFLYLVQHAEAKKEEEDPSRSLSEDGLHTIQKTSRFFAKQGLKVHKIFHSNKLRATQTAEVLAEYLKPEQGVSEIDGLAPLDDPKIWHERLKGVPEDVILVGHLPHLARLASLLVCEREKSDIISFQMAGIVCLKRDDSGAYTLQWMVTPEITP